MGEETLHRNKFHRSRLHGSLEVLHSFQVTEEMESVDRACKELYKNKEVLAIILKGVAREFENYSYREIMDFIEADSITDLENVSPGHGSVSGGSIIWRESCRHSFLW